MEFWTNERITAGSLWNDEIRTRLEHSDIALVLVSQAFLDSPFCTQIEIESFLDSCRKRGLLIFPIVLSPCEWEKYEWLSTRQFLPGGTETIEEHYTEPGRQKRLFLRIRKELRKAVDRVRQERGAAAGMVRTGEAAADSEVFHELLMPEVEGTSRIRDSSSATVVSGGGAGGHNFCRTGTTSFTSRSCTTHLSGAWRSGRSIPHSVLFLPLTPPRAVSQATIGSSSSTRESSLPNESTSRRGRRSRTH